MCGAGAADGESTPGAGNGRIRVMPRWTIDSPTTLDFDGVVALRVRIVAGSVAVLATADRPRLDVTEVSGQPLLVTHEAGILTVSYEDLTWDGLRGWLRPQRHSANITVTVQKDCPTQLGVVNATAIVSGVSARTSLKSMSGDLTLDGVTGAVDANTVSGNVEAQGLNGSVVFKSVSGDLTLADGQVGRLDAKTVSGRVTADVGLAPAGEMRVGTLSGEVAIRLPEHTSAQVNLRSTSGHVHSDFDALDSARGPSSKNVTGTLGGGSGKLSVASVSGDVTILRGSRRPAPGESAPGKTAEPGTAQDESAPGETAEMAESRTAQRESVPGETAETSESRTAQRESVPGETIQPGTAQDASASGETAQPGTAQDESAPGETTQPGTAQREPAPGETAQPGTAQREPAPGETAQPGTAQDGSAAMGGPAKEGEAR
jgi:hypothetical protein